MYRTEHPKPQFQRDNWVNLNGEWDFEIDPSGSGEERGFADPEKVLSGKIEVPFCPESRLSGVGNTDFMRTVWYQRRFTLTPEQLAGEVRLHFGAVDYEATVYINGTRCGHHTGGYVSFSVNITGCAVPGVNTVTVRADDDTRSPLTPSGKQSDEYASHTAFYTRTTGIWQTVWLEFLPKAHIIRTRYRPDTDGSGLSVEAELKGAGTLTAEASYRGQPMGSASVTADGGTVTFYIPLKEKHLWELGHGRLYDLTLTYGEDTVHSYFGLRSVQIDGYRFLLNGKPVFQRLVLDQGFYPDGICTAPDDADLKADIRRATAMGFNGARLHQKIFEERFLYHCDRLGYMVWAEYPDWGLDHYSPENIRHILPEWMEEIARDINHPAIIGWCPCNEVWNTREGYQPMLSMLYRITKQLDPTRPCIDVSGYSHVETDIYDLHNYEQDPDRFAAMYRSLTTDGTFEDPYNPDLRLAAGLPIFISEYGGIAWSSDPAGWGYGNAPKSPEEFIERLKGLTDVLLDNPRICGFCYTQLTDIEQEQNGLYTYDRALKFSPEIIRPIFSRPAAIEEE